MARKILVIASHPDDEVLGCGGTMARHADRGDEVHVAILAEGITSRDDKRDTAGRNDEMALLKKAMKKAHDVLGVKSTYHHDYPDNRMDRIDQLDINKLVESLIERISPDIIYTHHRGDVNLDHHRTHDAVVTACRPMPGNQGVREILFFEVQSSTEWQIPGSAIAFTPHWFVDISEYLETKREALRAYGSEMRDWPHARSLEAVESLARWRGSNIGVSAAEAFMLGRKLVL